MIEVEEHKDDQWMIIDDDVYCFSSMINHSGGFDIIKQLSGKDVTRIFYQIHPKSNLYKQILNKKYWIGKFHRKIVKEESTDFLKSKLIHQIVPDCDISMEISNDEQLIVKEQFREHIMSKYFPCLNAKIAFQRNTFGFGFYDILASKHTTKLLWHHLIDFINRQSDFWANNQIFTTYVACFRTPRDIDEIVFERLLWKQLQLIHNEDVQNGIKWAENYSDNPTDSNFGFSVGGRAFFIVGLHPNSSRRGRRFLTPTIIFNSLDQFTNLRQLKMFNEIQKIIRNNDLLQNKSINPNLIINHNKSDAFEYSGKLIQSDWIPDFKSLHQ
jgi:FPC/CPF motif-containing protein YcgG